MRRTIAVFTGNRADYGLQYPILRSIAHAPNLEYRLLVGGAHLQEDFGSTKSEILADGFQVHGEVAFTMDQDTLFATAQAIGSGILSLSSHLEKLRPDFLVVYADRYEGLAAMIAGTQMNIPTAHIEGGDYTEGGALDDSVRHAMTKLAHIHFATNAQAVERILRLGEEPWRVFNVGLPTLDLLNAGIFTSPEALTLDIGLDPARPIVLFCQHSVTTEFEAALSQIQPSLKALRRLAAEGWQVVATYPNNDAGGRAIIESLMTFKESMPITLTKSLGRDRFHGILHFIGHAGRGCLAGNSSAGIKETPAFGCPTVNIGSRQQGRLRAENVLDVPYDEEAIYQAIRRCETDEPFRLGCRICRNPYGAGNAGPRIAELLGSLPLGERMLRKKMTY